MEPWTEPQPSPKQKIPGEDDVGSEADRKGTACFQFINQKILVSTIIISYNRFYGWNYASKNLVCQAGVRVVISKLWNIYSCLIFMPRLLAGCKVYCISETDFL